MLITFGLSTANNSPEILINIHNERRIGMYKIQKRIMVFFWPPYVAAAELELSAFSANRLWMRSQLHGLNVLPDKKTEKICSLVVYRKCWNVSTTRIYPSINDIDKLGWLLPEQIISPLLLRFPGKFPGSCLGTLLDHFLYPRDLTVGFRGWNCTEKSDASHS